MGRRGENENDKVSKLRQRLFEPMLSRLTVRHSRPTADIPHTSHGDIHLWWNSPSLLPVLTYLKHVVIPEYIPNDSAVSGPIRVGPSSPSCTFQQTMQRSMYKRTRPVASRRMKRPWFGRVRLHMLRCMVWWAIHECDEGQHRFCFY